MLFLNKKSLSQKPVLIGLVLLFFAIISILVSSQLLYTRTVDVLTENLRQRLLTISITAAANINGEDLSVLENEADWTRPEWARVVNTLNRAKYSNKDVVFMYIFRKLKDDPNEMEFVADADSINPYANTDNNSNNDVDVNRDGVIEPEGPDKLQWPGQPYPEAVDIPEAFAAYDGPLTSEDLYTDEYGTVLTGYAPIFDNNGRVVAVLATDIIADDFFTITTQTLRPFIIFIIFLTLIISALTIIIIYTSHKHSQSLAIAAKKLEVANNRLKVLDKMKSEFVSIASHQLRSPLTSIRGYASMLLEGSYGTIPPKAKEALSRIAESSKYMVNSVEDYLNVSRIESGNMKYELADFNLKNTASDVVDELRQTAMQKGLLLTFRSDISSKGIVNADIGKTRQALHNLINNSIKYTERGSITVTIAEDLKNMKIMAIISDTGVGMSEETVDALFAKFSRAKDANKTNISGTGLGLFVAKQMIEHMGGTITASSEGVGKGSSFTLELPLQQ